MKTLSSDEPTENEPSTALSRSPSSNITSTGSKNIRRRAKNGQYNLISLLK